MAQLAVGLIGAGIGSAFGAPALGFSVGSFVGGLLFPTKQPNTVGPQMGDLSVTSSAYGADIPMGFGTMRIAGNIIWASPIQEVKNETGPNGGHKKGGKNSGGNVTEFTYYANWAVAFAQGPAVSVSRIWFDGVLVYNAIDDKGIDGSGTKQVSGLTFRFYLGDEEQVADPLIESWIAIGDVSPSDTKGHFKTGETPSTPAGEPKKVTAGSQAVPGHRGLCYMVIENFPLSAVGNHIPMVTAEISFGVEANFPYKLLSANSNPDSNLGLDDTTTPFPGVAVDLMRHWGFRISSSGSPAHTYLRKFDTDTMQEEAIKPITEVCNDPIGSRDPSLSDDSVAGLICGLDGFLYILGMHDIDATGHSWLLVKVDPNSMSELSRVDFGPMWGLVIPAGGGDWCMTVGIGYTGKLQFWVVVGDNIGQAGVAFTGDRSNLPMEIEQTPGGSGIWTLGTPYSGLFHHMWGGMPDVAGDNILHAWGYTLWMSSHPFGWGNPVEIWRIDTVDQIFENTVNYTVAELAAMADVTPADFGGGMAGAHGPWADISTASMIFAVQCITSGSGLGDLLLVSWSLGTRTLNWVLNLSAHSVGLPSGDANDASVQSAITNHELAWQSGGTVVVVDTLYGVITDVSSWPGGVPTADSLFGAQVFDGYHGTIISGAQSVKLFVGRHNPTETTVGSIVRSVCKRVALNSADLDTTDIDTIVIKGYFIGQPTSVRDCILPLAQAHLFDVVESDGIIKFPQRGQHPVVRTLHQSTDLAPVEQNTNLTLLETRAQEVDLPIYLAVTYYDGNNNYQQGTRIRRRSAAPLEGFQGVDQNSPTVRTQNVASLQWPIVLDSQTATEAADRYLFAAWLSRTTYQQVVPWTHLDLDPADRVLVVLDDGTTYSERVTKMTVGADYSIELGGVAENSAIYDSKAKGGDDFVIVPTPASGPAFSKLFLIPSTLMSDGDSLGQENSRLYYAASNYDHGSWPGAAIYKSTDLATWSQVDLDIFRAAWGTTGTALPDNDDPFSWDDETELVVYQRTGAVPVNATDAEILDGANSVAVFNTRGEPEIIQFGTVSPNSDGSITLTHLLRGRRGSDAFCFAHAAGQNVVFLGSSTRLLAISTSELNQLRYYRAVGNGLTIDFADTESISDPGNDLKPYAPVHPDAVLSAGDAVLTWTRRTRLGGELRDGVTDVPLNEGSEAYEVDVMTGPGTGVVARTLTGISSPTVTYTATMAAADFGGMPAHLTLRVYQMSAVVGRGLTVERTVQVN